MDHELLKPNSSVALHKHSNALVDVLPPEADSSIAMLTAEEKPDVCYSGEHHYYMIDVISIYVLRHFILNFVHNVQRYSKTS